MEQILKKEVALHLLIKIRFVTHLK